MCNCQTCQNVHYVTTATTGADNVELTVSNSTDIGNLDSFILIMNRNIQVTGSPLPVTVNVNGTAVNLLNKYSLPINSNRIPRRAIGSYVVPTSGNPYVILFSTPYCRCNA